ncbi:MAG: ribose 5-phosphate isomerase B [Arcticibacterium sp.]|jgi:ribose 5-phosphate isomerase B|tara:strand:+ start:6270 stop:6701 length:432 start_codon:yes stop_codon:yes gene_type:complete
MIIAIGNDHAGTAYKNAIINQLKLAGYEVLNFGTDTEDSVDYPDHIHPVATAVSTQKASLGIIICGSGNGATMTANKHQNIRAALCWNKEIVALAKQHNNANILSLPARYISLPQALEMVQVFLDTSFEGGRHATRVNKIACS